jgi:hypothetical protein
MSILACITNSIKLIQKAFLHFVIDENKNKKYLYAELSCVMKDVNNF